jgi:D-3-phosphoglycerate dehydrogenase
LKILFADSFDKSALATLQAHGHECRSEPGLTADDLPTALGGADALVVRSTKVTAAALESSDSLRLIVRAGAGTNTIDKQTAANRGIYVCNTPGKNAVAVAELTMALLLAIDRRLPDNVAALRDGRWDKKRFAKAQGLFGKTMGIIGLGAIGLEVAVRAKAFGLDVLVIAKDRPAPTVKRIEEIGIRVVDNLDELLASSDIVSIHVPLSEATHHLVDTAFLGKLRDGAWIINTSRGDIVDGPALLEAVENRGMAAGLDVYPDEPSSGQADFESELAQHPAIYGTHHIGASTEQAQQAIADEVVEIIQAFENGRVLNSVNTETHPVGSTTLVVRHRDRVGVLSSVLALLKNAGINIEQMENAIFAGANAACATLHVAGSVDADLLNLISAQDGIIQAIAREKSGRTKP